MEVVVIAFIENADRQDSALNLLTTITYLYNFFYQLIKSKSYLINRITYYLKLSRSNIENKTSLYEQNIIDIHQKFLLIHTKLSLINKSNLKAIIL